MTAEEVVAEFKLASVRTLRTLRSQGLPTVKLGSARLIDHDDMVAFIDRKKEVLTRVEPRLPQAFRQFRQLPHSTQEAYDRLLGLDKSQKVPRVKNP